MVESGIGTKCCGHKDCKSLEAPFCKATGVDDEGVCARCSECLQCSDGVEGTCGFRCERIWPRWVFPLQGIEDECIPKKIDVNCDVCEGLGYFDGCNPCQCIEDGSGGWLSDCLDNECEDGDLTRAHTYCVEFELEE